MEASDLLILKLHDQPKKTDILVKEFVNGHNQTFSKEDQEMLANISYDIPDFLHHTRQKYKDMIMAAEYQETKAAWSDFNGAMGPFLLRTDFGICTFFHPLLFKPSFEWMDFHRQNISAQTGLENGLQLLVDIEQFNYGFTNFHGKGVKIIIHNPRYGSHFEILYL